MAGSKAPTTPHPRSKPRTPAKSRVARTVVPSTALMVRANPYADTAVQKSSTTFQLFRNDYAQIETDDTQEPYERLLKKYGKSTTWVYIAVNRIASATSQIPIQLIYKAREGQAGALVKGYDRGLQDLLYMPNPFQSWLEFSEACSVSLNLTGNLFIEKVDTDGDDRPEELYVLNPGRMSIVGDAKEFVRGYIYTINGRSIPFPRDAVIHVKLPHPCNDYYGLAPTSAARAAIDTDMDAVEWNRTFMRTGGWPGGAIETDESLDEDSQKRLKKEIKQSLSRGKETAGKILLLTNGLKYNTIAIKPKDSDWLDARRMSRDEILAIYGVPYAIASLFSTEQTTARSAGVEQQIKQFYRGTVCSHLKRLLDALNRELTPLFSDQYKLIPDLRSVPALADDVQTELMRAQAVRTLVTAGFPVNQVMAYFYPTMAPVAWGDVYMANQATVAISGPYNPVLQKEDGTPLAGGISGPSDGTVGKPTTSPDGATPPDGTAPPANLPPPPSKAYLLGAEGLQAFEAVKQRVMQLENKSEDI